MREAAPEREVVVLTASEDDGEPARRDPRRRRRLPAEERAARADRRLPRAASSQGEAALSGAVARRLLDQVREAATGTAVPESIADALGARARGAAAPRPASRHGRDRAAAVHLRAHGALAREEPALEARRLLAPRGARAARERARRLSLRRGLAHHRRRRSRWAGGRAAAAAGALVIFAAPPAASRAAVPPDPHDPCAHLGRDSCGTTGVGAYRTSPYGVRWYGDFRGAVPASGLTCSASTCASGTRRARTATAARRPRTSPQPRRRARLRRGAPPDRVRDLDLRPQLQSGAAGRGDALRPFADGRRTARRAGRERDEPISLARAPRLARAAARDAGPYRVEMQLPARLVVGTDGGCDGSRPRRRRARAPERGARAIRDRRKRPPAQARTDSAGVAHVSVVPPPPVAGLRVTVRTEPLASTEPEVFVPTAAAARALTGSGSQLPASQRLVRDGDAHGRGRGSAAEACRRALRTSPSARPSRASSRRDRARQLEHVRRRGPLGAVRDRRTRSPARAATRWSGSFTASGRDTTTTTAPVQLDHAGYYGYRASISAQSSDRGGDDVVSPARDDGRRTPHPALTTSASAGGRPSGRARRRPHRGTRNRRRRRSASRPSSTAPSPLAPRSAATPPTSSGGARWPLPATATRARSRSRSRTPASTGTASSRSAVSLVTVTAPTGAPPPGRRRSPRREIVTGRGDVAAFPRVRPRRRAYAPGPDTHRLARDRRTGRVASGIDVPDGVLGIPSDIHHTGWWRDGAAPGDATGAILVAGHVDSAGGGLGAFLSLRRARAGDRVELDTASGRTFAYRVVSVRLYPKSALPTDVFSRVGKPRLVLVTCGGPFSSSSGHYPDDVVVTAVPA